MPPQSTQSIITQILALNSPDKPFTIKSEDNEIIATWNLVDARWYGFFYQAGMKRTYEFHLFLDEDKHQARYLDKEFSVSWNAGLPVIGVEMHAFRGKEVEVGTKTGFGIKQDGSVGEVYHFDFNTNQIKKPIFDIIKQNGWTIKTNFWRTLFGMA